MVTSEEPLDEVTPAPFCHILMKVTLESFVEDQPTEQDMAELAVEMSNIWTRQVMTPNALITYEAIPMQVFSFGATDEEQA